MEKSKKLMMMKAEVKQFVETVKKVREARNDAEAGIEWDETLMEMAKKQLAVEDAGRMERKRLHDAARMRNLSDEQREKFEKGQEERNSKKEKLIIPNEIKDCKKVPETVAAVTGTGTGPLVEQGSILNSTAV